jgi:predicted nucleic acid-binding protein
VALVVVQARCLLDTNIVIGLLKGNDDCTALIQSANCDLADMAVSQITRMELLGFAGLSASDEQTVVQLLSCVQVVLLDEVIESRTIALRRQFKVKLPDAIIVATALVGGLPLLTLDQALLKMIATVNQQA